MSCINFKKLTLFLRFNNLKFLYSMKRYSREFGIVSKIHEYVNVETRGFMALGISRLKTPV